MWNPYEIEKNYEQQMKELEKRARYAHRFENEDRTFFRLSGWVALLPIIALLCIGFFVVFEH